MVPTPDRLRELLAYDPDTGALTWRVTRGSRAQAGAPAGCVSRSKGATYRCVRVDGVLLWAHRVVFAIVCGAYPTEVDHKDGDGLNNRWANLRDSDRAVNTQNVRRAKRQNLSGMLGVSSDRGRFAAKIWVDGRNRYLGAFDTAKAAHERYVQEKRAVHAGCTI